MVSGNRRLDVCLGDFAVSIQGFEDPLGVLEEVLRLGQRFAAETPELLNSEAVFDEATIGEVIDRVARRSGADANAFGAVPGIVLVHRGAETDGGIEALRGAGSGEDGPDDPLEPDEPAGAGEGGKPAEAFAFEALRRRFEESERGAGAAPDPSEPELADPLDGGAEDEHEATVVNIFAAPQGEAEGPRHRPLFGARAAKAPAAAPAAEGEEPAGPVQMPEAPDRHVEGGILGDRFQSLLKKVHGRTAVGEAAEAAAKPEAKPLEAGRDRMTPAQVAEKAGVEDANDAILSAAGFLTVIRRQPRFTRREIMAVVDEIPGEFPRTLEAQIKGIGRLVRKGQLRRADDDHYGLSTELTSEFRELLKG